MCIVISMIIVLRMSVVNYLCIIHMYIMFIRYGMCIMVIMIITFSMCIMLIVRIMPIVFIVFSMLSMSTSCDVLLYVFYLSCLLC